MQARSLIGAVFAVLSLAPAAMADDWPQWRGPNRDGVWSETGVIDKFDGGKAPIVWRRPVAGGYSGPTVAGGRVYVSDRVTQPAEMERILCFDAADGKPLWTRPYESKYSQVGYGVGPRAAVTVSDGRAYALGTMGHLHCLDAATGEILWRHDCRTEYEINMPTWGIAAAPLIEDDLVIVQIGGQDACVVAFDRKTGRQQWKALSDKASYSAPIAITQAGKRVVVVWTAERMVGLDARTGETCWAEPFPTKMGTVIPTPVVHRDMLFGTSFFEGSIMLRLRQDAPAIEKVWRRGGPNEIKTEALHSTIATPIFRDDGIYGVCSYGELRCLNPANGERIWESLDVMPKARWATAHLVPNADKVWLFTEKGDLVICELSPAGYREISRAHLIGPTKPQSPERGNVCWAHPAFAGRRVYVRNDEELVCADLSASPTSRPATAVSP